ncbi:MAG TPA: DNA-directed RNA polymerase subunit omega [Candidatus Acidoferrum sp.]|jgi:DNA-directed RNA polymerase subunit omega|nr:DNA-directed RNA polymerase subunit omega [Candidatus Acidoferrum sp.]
MNAELLKKASQKVENPAVLVNLISRRVRQLSRHDSFSSHALVPGADNLGAADVALREIAEEKMGWDMPIVPILTRPRPKKVRSQGK